MKFNDDRLQIIGRLYRLNTLNDFQIADIMNKSIRWANRLQRLNVAYCNGIIDGDAFDKKAAPFWNLLGQIWAGIAVFEFETDPRGYSFYVKFSDGAGNDLGGRGWGLGIE